MTFFRSRNLLLALSLTTVLAGCSEKTVNEPVAQPVEAPAAKPAEPQEYPQLAFDDEKLLGQTRIQYLVHYKYGLGNRTKIRSMSIDGTDLRLVDDLSFPTESNLSHLASRSPNRRYLATAPDNNPDKTSSRYIYYIVIRDFKTGEQKIINNDGGGYPSFTWSKDSSKLYFRANFKVWEYDLNTEKTRLISDKLYGEFFFLLEDQKTILSVSDKRYLKYDVATGKELSRHDFPSPKKDTTGFASLSPNQKTLFVTQAGGEDKGRRIIRVYDLTTDQNVLVKSDRDFRDLSIPTPSYAQFLDDNTIVYESYDKSPDVKSHTITVLDLNTLAIKSRIPISDRVLEFEILPPLQ